MSTEEKGNVAKESMDVTMADINQMTETEVDQLHATVTSRKGWVTTKRRMVEKNKENVESIREHNNKVDSGEIPGPKIDADQARDTITKLRQSMTVLENQMLKFETSAKWYIEVLNGTNVYKDRKDVDVKASIQKTEDSMAKHDTEWINLETAMNNLQLDIARQYGGNQPRQTPARGNAQPNSALKPSHMLGLESTWDEQTEWITEFTNYFDTSNMAELSPSVQRHYLRQCIDDDLWTRIKAMDDAPGTPVVPTARNSGIFKIIFGILDKKNPLMSKRAEVFQLRFQKTANGDNEEFSSWESRLYNIWKAGRMDEMEKDDWRLTICYAFAHDQLKAKMIKEKDLTWEKMKEIGRDFDIYLRESKAEGIHVATGSVNQINKSGATRCSLCDDQLKRPGRFEIWLCKPCLDDARTSYDPKSSRRIGTFKCTKCRSEGNHRTQACKGNTIKIRWKKSQSRDRGRQERRGSRNGSQSRERSRDRRSRDSSRNRSGDRRSRKPRDKSPYAKQSFTKSGFEVTMVSDAYEHRDSEASADEVNIISETNDQGYTGEPYAVFEDSQKMVNTFRAPKEKNRRLKLIKAFARRKHDQAKTSSGTSWAKLFAWVMSLMCARQTRGLQKSGVPKTDEIVDGDDEGTLANVNTIECVNLTSVNLLKESGKTEWIRRTSNLYNLKAVLGNAEAETKLIQGRKRVNTTACGDSGAFRSLCGPDVAKKLGTTVKMNEEVAINAANGQTMDYKGSTNIQIMAANGQTVNSTFLVSADLKGRVIVGRGDMIALKMISKNFPDAALCEECWEGKTRSD